MVRTHITNNYTTACHTGQQQQLGLARGSKQPNANGAKLLAIRPDRPGLDLVSIHQMALPERGAHITAYYSIYRPRKDERLSWPGWLTCSGRFTHISGHPTAAGQAQDRESSPAKD